MKNYVLVGTGSRCEMYINAIHREFAGEARLLAICDSNSIRCRYWHDRILSEFGNEVRMYRAEDFDQMIREQHPDKVIVTSMDRTHHTYICRAMELGCDVISEKPMTVDEVKCHRIIDAIHSTGRHLTVTFNYRYSPRNTKIKELLASGICGEITTVHFEWLLDTSHGADYFRRWHRNKNNNGGLLVHKSTHHFDLMNWWLDSAPKTVFAMGDLKFYGRENAERRGVTQFYSRARGSEIAARDPFALHIDEQKDTVLMGLYYNAEKEDGYYRDQSVFGDGISIEDNMSVMVRYENNTVMTYSLCAHQPWEGYRVAFNGTRGRLEFNVVEVSDRSANVQEDFSRPGMRELEGSRSAMTPEIIFQPMWGKPQIITYEETDKEGHGGGDIRMLRDVFLGAQQDDPLGHAAGYEAGAKSIMTGIAANISMRTGLPVNVRDYVDFTRI